MIYRTHRCEKSSLEFYRLFYEDMKNGNVLTDVNLRILRPGLALIFYYIILAARSRDIKKGTALIQELVD